MRDCSESEGEGGAMPARRTRSVAPVGRRLLSTATASLSISTSDLSGGGRPARAAPALCPQHRPPRVCRRASCDALHVCRLYVDGFCPHGDAACRWGHVVTSDDNQAALSAHQLQTLSERELLWLVRALLRQTAPVAAEEYRSQLAICAEYAADARCGRPDCFMLHLCPRLAEGGCLAGDSCRWSHRLTDSDNVMVLLRLRCAELSEAEVLDRLAQRLDDEDSSSESSIESQRGLDYTDSERELTDTDADLAPLAAGGGAVGGACSSREGSGTGAGAPSAADRHKNQETGAGLTQNGKTERDGSLGAADRPSKQGTGASDGQVAHPPGIGQQTTRTTVTERQPQAGLVSDNQAGKPATPGTPSTKERTKDEMMRVARTLDVCHHYSFPSKCLNKTCGKLHLCRYYVAGICPYAIVWCSRSHKLADAYNKSVLAEHQLLKLSHAELLKALRAGYLARIPITGLERQFLVQLCRPFQQGRCKMADSCTRVHVCDGYIFGKCESSTVCGLSHNLNSQHNAAVVRDLGLYSLTANDIRKILEKPVSAKAMWESSAPKQQRPASSGDSAVRTSVGDQQTSSGTEKPAVSPPSNVASTGAVQAADASTCGSSSAPAPSSVDARSVRSPATVAIAANAGGDRSREEAQTAAASESTRPVAATQAAKGVSGAGKAVGGDRQTMGSESGHGSGDGGSGEDGAGQPRDPGQQSEKADVPRNPAQQADKSDVPRNPAQQADKSDVPRNPGQQAEKAVATGQPAKSANPSQQTAIKPATAQQSKSGPAPVRQTGQTPAKKLTKEEMMLVARNLDVCRENFFPSQCKRKECAKLHLCRFFVASKCTYAIYKCVRSHYLWSDPHNTRVLRNHQLEKLSEQDVFRALRDGYLARNPVTDVERRFLVQMCRPHQRGFCKRVDVCTRVHVCDGFIFGKCESSTVCGLSHNLNSRHNAAVIRDLGLSSLTASDIRKLLEKPVTAKEMWDSSVPKQPRAASSHPTQGVAVRSDGRPADSTLSPASTSGGKSVQNSGGDSSQKSNKTAAVAGSGPLESTTAAKTPGSSQTVVVPLVTAESGNPESQDSESDDSDDSEDLSEDGPALCAVHASSGRCQRADCDGFHICGYYLANLCRRQDGVCPLGHSFSAAHNVKMMDTYGLLGGSPEHFQDLLDQMTLRARITFSNEAEEKVAMCIPFNSPGGCQSEACCGRFHMCNRFLAGKCTRSDCDLCHDLSDEHNRRVREVLGLAATPGGRHRHAWATDRDVVEMIRAKLGVKPGVYASPEVVESAGEETKSTAENAKPEKSTAENTKPKEGKPDGKTVPATEETKSTVTEAELTTKTTKSVSNGDKTGPDVPEPTPEVTASPRPAGDSAVAPLPSVCGSLGAGRRCSDAGCIATSVHVCPHFLAGACRRQHCTLGHRLNTEPNLRALRLVGRAVTQLNHDTLIKELYTASPVVRRSHVYSKLRICISNNHSVGCKTVGCPFIHICQRFVSGRCEEKVCVKGHSVQTEGNKKKLRALKLETAPVEEVLEMLRAVHGVRSECE